MNELKQEIAITIACNLMKTRISEKAKKKK